MSSNTHSEDADEPVAWMFPDDIERFQTEETFAQAFSVKCGSPTQGTTLPLYLHPPKPAEPEAEYDFYGVIPLTHRKAKGIIKDRGYHVTGFVLSRPDGDKCIVDMSAVRWLSGKEFFEMMHPPVVSPTAEPEAEPVGYAVKMIPRGLHFIGFVGEEETEEEIEDYGPDQIVLLYTRPEPARKPMNADL